MERRANKYDSKYADPVIRDDHLGGHEQNQSEVLLGHSQEEQINRLVGVGEHGLVEIGDKDVEKGAVSCQQA